MATKSKQLSNNNYYVVLLLITLLAVGVTAVGGKMLVSSIVRDAKVLGAKNKANDQLAKDLDAAPKLVDNFKNMGTTSQLIADALPNTADFPGLIAMMENLSTESGVSLKSIAPSAGTATSTPIPVSASASGTTGAAGAASGTTTAATGGDVPTSQAFNFNGAFDGTYQSFLRLISNLESSARPVRVNSLQLSGSGGSLSVQLEGTTYYQDKATVPFKMEPVK